MFARLQIYKFHKIFLTNGISFDVHSGLEKHFKIFIFIVELTSEPVILSPFQPYLKKIKWKLLILTKNQKNHTIFFPSRTNGDSVIYCDIFSCESHVKDIQWNLSYTWKCMKKWHKSVYVRNAKVSIKKKSFEYGRKMFEIWYGYSQAIVHAVYKISRQIFRQRPWWPDHVVTLYHE